MNNKTDIKNSSTPARRLASVAESDRSNARHANVARVALHSTHALYPSVVIESAEFMSDHTV